MLITAIQGDMGGRRERERERLRQTDRQRKRQTDRQGETQRDRQTERERGRERERSGSSWMSVQCCGSCVQCGELQHLTVYITWCRPVPGATW